MTVTRLLEQAIEAVRNLPEAEQDAIASRILAELEDEKRWDDAFSKTQEKLSRLAQEAREDIASGHVHDVGVDEL